MKKKIKEYSLTATYDGCDFNFDNELEKIVGHISGGSGCGFGGRELDWYFKTQLARDAAADKLRKIKKYNLQIMTDNE